MVLLVDGVRLHLPDIPLTWRSTPLKGTFHSPEPPLVLLIASTHFSHPSHEAKLSVFCSTLVR
ncbi:hypothetical protein E2C01_036593 [Portunus trituberculatus]|uniref:Uncharacterized protein n=1 Tax=Portunus trituberculatus TaxID=210409 RepID=A0A5B7FCW5_PORTR|nr:hypothetical protein [Portunus trituberculatus]